MSSNDSAIGTALDRDTVRSTSKLLIGALAVVGVLAVVTLLPGVDRLVPFAPVTFAAVATAVVALAVAGILLYAAPKFALLTRLALGEADAEGDARPDRIVENAGGVVHWLVVFGAVLVAYRGLAGVAVPVLNGAAWAYDAAFLFVALVPVVFLVARLTVTVDPLAELVADRVAGDDGTADNDGAGEDGTADGDGVGEDGTADNDGAGGDSADKSDRTTASETDDG
ncbi:hypothetical protein C470_01268 [Halorubrum distributum JCM 13561]|uniref:Uncharacterized protein n=1 Tax=Halorubrum distributum JCM 13561 TaxID=1227483 RepID=M0P3S8_9EURY|nr:hypothetical protein [Halorubrum litoreum]EMA64189.1 hypothetical protein C470_01268 [Halorubrum litoreum JCM 13561]